jgi:hypothetical protein
MTDISTLDKDGLAEFAKKEFNVELDLTKPWAKLLAETKKLQSGPSAPAAEKAAVVEKAPATHILNRDTGFVFPWTEQLRKHLTNAIPCDANGNPV